MIAYFIPNHSKDYLYISSLDAHVQQTQNKTKLRHREVSCGGVQGNLQSRRAKIVINMASEALDLTTIISLNGSSFVDSGS